MRCVRGTVTGGVGTSEEGVGEIGVESGVGRGAVAVEAWRRVRRQGRQMGWDEVGPVGRISRKCGRGILCNGLVRDTSCLATLLLRDIAWDDMVVEMPRDRSSTF